MSFTNTRIGSRSRRATSWANPCPPRRRATRLPSPSVVAMTVPEAVAVNRLMSCLERNRREGGQSPGIDGLRYFEFGRQEASRALAKLQSAVLDRSYVAPPALPVNILKKDGTYRQLMLDVITKRALTTSVRGALNPVLKPRMSPITYSVGGEGSGVPAMLAELAAAFEYGAFEVILNLDVRRAFPSVPIDRLMAAVRESVTDDHMLWLIETLVRGEGNETTGLPQGLAISPLLLDLYMSDGFDPFWSNAHDMPFLIRYVDNIPCLVRNVYEGCEVVERCRHLLLGLDLGLKDQTGEKDIINLSAGEATELLGFRVSSDGRRLKYGVAEEALDTLGDRFREAHDTDNPPVTAKAVTQGWITTMGPAFANPREDDTTNRVLSTARRHGFKEANLEHLQQAWDLAHRKWNDRFLQPARERIRNRWR